MDFLKNNNDNIIKYIMEGIIVDDDKTDEYYNYWEAKGYEFIEYRTTDKYGFTKFAWIKRLK
jgi:hypothetical protein